MEFVSVTREDLALGTPLPWDVYSPKGEMLMPAGSTLDQREQLQALLASDPCRASDWISLPPILPEKDTATGNAGATAPRETAESTFSFNDMRLRVGERIQLQLPSAVSQQRHVVKLIGYVDNVDVLVTAPMENGLRVPIREKDKVVARIFSTQKAYGFSSIVQKVCKLPYDFLHLSFPLEVQGTVIRSSPRVRTKIITTLSKLDDAASSARQSGVIVNLSADGALVKVRDRMFEPGQRVQMAFRVRLHHVDTYLAVNAIIRSTVEDENRGERTAAKCTHGIQFEALPTNDTVILKSLIYQQMIEHPHTLL